MLKTILLVAGLLAGIHYGATGQTQNPTAGQMTETLEKADTVNVWFSFETGKDKLLGNQNAALDEIAAMMNSNPEWKFGLACYCDNSGSVVGSNIVTRNRSITIIEELARRKVDRNRIVVFAGGASHFIADNSTADGRARNNRVAIVINSGDDN